MSSNPVHGDLTSPAYWGERQSRLKSPRLGKVEQELIASILPYLRGYDRKKFLEIGCSPGIVSSFLCRYVDLIPYGIDYSPHSEMYLENMRQIAKTTATLYQCDVRDYAGEEDFDVVASFGLVEHFANSDDIMFQHHRLCKPGGLVVITMPNFRYVQWFYHVLFDKTDLRKHNLNVMNVRSLRDYAARMGHEVLFVGHVGSTSFWGFEREGSRLAVFLRKAAVFFVWEITNRILVHFIPVNNRFSSPWIVYIGRKKT